MSQYLHFPPWRQDEAITTALAERAPEVFQALEGAHVSLHDWLRVTGPLRSESALSLLILEACNDYLALVRDLACGRGRTSLRHARALAEAAVGVMEVVHDPDLRTRYLDHLILSERRMADLDLPLRHLRGAELRSARHHRRVFMRDTEDEAAAVIGRHGSSFAARWRGLDMRARMSGVGFHDDHYDFYAVASDHVHGTPGATATLRREVDHGSILRTGPALAVAPLAYLYGHRYMLSVVETVEDEQGGDATRLFIAALREAQRAWPAYRRAVVEMDGETWPEDPPLDLLAYCCLGPGGQRRWFVEDVYGDRACEVDPPAPDRIRQAALDRIDEAQIAFANEGRFDNEPSLNAHGLVPIPIIGCRPRLPDEPKWIPATTVILRRDGDPLPVDQRLKRLRGE